MESVQETLSVSSYTNESSDIKNRAISAPLIPLPLPTKKSELKPQISAPSYLCSLKDNPAAPFKKPERESKPKLLIGSIINEAEVIEIIAAAEAEPNGGLMKCLGHLLVDKKIIENYSLSEKNFVASLLAETIDYAAQRNFSAFKVACLLAVYIATHVYFKCYYWQSPNAVWNYFKELMIRHTIEDPPDGQEVFEPEECYDILTHFHTLYLTNLPLIHIISFESYRLKFLWPFKTK